MPGSRRGAGNLGSTAQSRPAHGRGQSGMDIQRESVGPGEGEGVQWLNGTVETAWLLRT